MATDLRIAYRALRARSPGKALLYICQLMFALNGDLDVSDVKAYIDPNISNEEELKIETWRKKWQAEVWGTRFWRDHVRSLSNAGIEIVANVTKVYPSIEAYNIMHPTSSYAAMSENQLKAFWKNSLGPNFHVLLVQLRPLAEAVDVMALIRYGQADGQNRGKHQSLFEHLVRVFVRACRMVRSHGPHYDSIANSDGQRRGTNTTIRQYADISRRDDGVSITGGVSLADFPLAAGWFEE